MAKQLLPLLMLALLLSACSSSRIIMLGSSQVYPPTNPEQVIIYVDAADLPVSYDKLAIISTNYVAGADKSKWRNVRKKCAAIGANGVIPKMELRASGGAKVAAAIFGTVATDKAEFLAIRASTKTTTIVPNEPVPPLVTAPIRMVSPQEIPRMTSPADAASQPARKADQLVRKDGTVLAVFMIELSENEVVYKRANNPNGPTYRGLKSDFSYVKYGDTNEIERFIPTTR